jgi:hypothetical protein
MALTRSEEAKIIRTRVRQRLAGDNCETTELGACGRMVTRKRSNGLQSATKEEALGRELLFGEIAPSRDAQNGSALRWQCSQARSVLRRNSAWIVLLHQHEATSVQLIV